jgi:hypothetical protein
MGRTHVIGQTPIISIGGQQRRNPVRTRTSQWSAALVIAVSLLLVASYATEAGDKDKKLTPAAGKIALKDGKGEAKGKLDEKDAKDASRTDCYCKVYTVKLEAGKTYQLDCNSDWDNWLRIEDAKGKQLAEDDDSGGGTNAQILFECKTAGEYRVIVTSFDAGTTGDFTVTVAAK